MKNLFKHFILLTIITSLTFGCSVASKKPATLGEESTGFAYIPVDPLPVRTDDNLVCMSQDLLELFPDQAVRIAVGSFDTAGTITYGPVKFGEEGHTYQVVLDYISSDTVTQPVKIMRIVEIQENGVNKKYFYNVFDPRNDGRSTYKIATADEIRDYKTMYPEIPTSDLYTEVAVPVYVGIGLRLTASIRVLKGTVNLSSLGSIAADAQNGNISGTMTVQTLGITGPKVSASVPLPSELNQTTIQNSILALGTIKANLYDTETSCKTRVVGIYNPIGGGSVVGNLLTSYFAQNPVQWTPRSCSNDNNQ